MRPFANSHFVGRLSLVRARRARFPRSVKPSLDLLENRQLLYSAIAPIVYNPNATEANVFLLSAQQGGQINFYEGAIQNSVVPFTEYTVAKSAAATAISAVNPDNVFALNGAGNISYYTEPSNPSNTWPVATVETGIAATAISAFNLNGTTGVLALNANGNIYCYIEQSNGSWNRTTVTSGGSGDTAISSIVVGSTPTVFAVNCAGNVTAYTQTTGGSWTGSGITSGGSGDVAVSGWSSTSVFVVNCVGNVINYTLSNGKWTGSGVTTGGSADVSVSALSNTSVFALNADGEVSSYALTNGSWVGTLVGDDAASAIATTYAYNPYVGAVAPEFLALDGNFDEVDFFFQEGSYWNYATAGEDYGQPVVSAVSSNGAPTDFEIQPDGTVTLTSGGSTGAEFGAYATAISAASSTSCFVLYGFGEVALYTQSGSTWNSSADFGSAITKISASSSDSVYVLNGAGNIWEFTESGGQWGASTVWDSGGIKAIAGASTTQVMLLNGAGDAYAFGFTDGEWEAQDSYTEYVAVSMSAALINGLPGIYFVTSSGTVVSYLFP
jgi:hypothetical protein